MRPCARRGLLRVLPVPEKGTSFSVASCPSFLAAAVVSRVHEEAPCNHYFRGVQVNSLVP